MNITVVGAVLCGVWTTPHNRGAKATKTWRAKPLKILGSFYMTQIYDPWYDPMEPNLEFSDILDNLEQQPELDIEMVIDDSYACA